MKRILEADHTYKAVFEASPDAIIIVDNTGKILLVNNQAEDLFGYTKKEIIGQGIELLIPDRFKKIHTSERKNYSAHPVPRKMGEDLELFGKKKDRSEFPVEISLSPVDLPGKLFAAAVRDVSKRKEIEKKLLDSELRYRATLDNMLEGIRIFDFNFRYLYVNDACVKQSKHSKEELLGKTLMEIYEGIEETEIFKTLQQCMNERISKHPDIKFTFPDKSTGWFELSIQPVPEGIFVLSIDITKRKKAEEKIKSSEQILAQSQKVAQTGSWEWDIVANEIYWSEELYNIYGLKPDEFEANYEGFLHYTHPDDREMVHDTVQQAFTTHKYFNFYYRIIRPDGTIRILNGQGNVVADENGRPIKMLGIGADVTEKKKAEETIASQKKFFEAILKNIPVDIAVFDSSHHSLFINHHAIGDADTRQWMIGKNDFENYYNNGTDDTLVENRKKLFDEAVQTRTDMEWVEEHKTKQGATNYILRNLHPFFENGLLQYLIGYGIDITTQKKTELQLKEAICSAQNAYKDLEQFSYMISHDLQEPLRMVRGFLNLLQLETSDQLNDSAKEYVHFALDGAERMKNMIKDLLQFSRVGTNKEDFEEVNINEIMQYVKQVLKENIDDTGADILIKDLPKVTGIKTLLNQLFINLVSNALKYHGDEKPEIEIGSKEETDKWVFYVKDNGIGIETKFFDAIFAIFQRLHAGNKYPGTGIGLAICKKIVEKHGGNIWVESETHKGSTFFFTIPKKIIYEQENPIG